MIRLKDEKFYKRGVKPVIKCEASDPSGEVKDGCLLLVFGFGYGILKGFPLVLDRESA